MIVFGIHCNIFILLPIWLKTCWSNYFSSFFKGKMFVPKKIRRISEVLCAWACLTGSRCPICPGLIMQFIFVCTWWDNLPKYGKVWYILFRHRTYYSLWWLCFVCRFCDTFVNYITWVAVFIQNPFQFINFTMKFDQKQKINEKTPK